MLKPWVFYPTRILAFLILTPFFGLEVEGRDKLPTDTGFVLVAKHQRWEDIPLISMASCRALYYVAKHELFKFSLANWYLKSLGGIPLNRKRPLESRKSLHEIMSLLKEGQGVVVFPEGTYYKDVVGPGKVGIIKLVQSKLNLPFLPLGIKYSRIRFRTRVKMRFGAPMRAVSGESSELFLERIMEEISVLSGLPRAG